MKSRLQKILEDKNLSPTGLARLLGVQPSTISHILSGRNKPGFDFLHALLKAFPDISAAWLITGQGPVYTSQISASEKTDVTGKEEPRLFGENASETLKRPENEVKSSPLPAYGKEKPSERKVKRIVLYYDDHSYEEYFPG
ncbi:MAG: helix-turn-helix domain-containing protein [Bacteroidales bacterium]